MPQVNPKPNPDDELTMDRAARRLRQLHNVIEWLLSHWSHFPDNLFQLIVTDGGQPEYVPYDVREYFFELARQDFANIITPTVAWRLLAEKDRVSVPPESPAAS